ncbi:hypothetical protein SAMN05216332_10847 [Nitrosospira briensis]|nr:hypothetical protein SAMN05216332_10847 [Nitrosospira briensis]
MSASHLPYVGNGEKWDLSLREGDKLKIKTVPLLFQFTRAFSEVTHVRASFPLKPRQVELSGKRPLNWFWAGQFLPDVRVISYPCH